MYILRDTFFESGDQAGEQRVKHDGSRSSSVRIIGLGNELRGDDAVGLLAARRLRQAVGNRAEVIEAEMAGVDLIELMEGARVVILIDAARSGKNPGMIHRLDASDSKVHPCQTPGRSVGLLPEDRDLVPLSVVGLDELDGLDEHAPGATAGVVDSA